MTMEVGSPVLLVLLPVTTADHPTSFFLSCANYYHYHQHYYYYYYYYYYYSPLLEQWCMVGIDWFASSMILRTATDITGNQYSW